MSGQYIKCKYEASIATVRLDRPEVLNAYNEEFLDELQQTLEEVFNKDDLGAVILTAAGKKAFSVGGDIDYLEKLDSEGAKKLSQKGHQICNLIEESCPVVIAAVDGYALGGGMELALACDIRIASTRARFGQPEVKLGIIPAFGGTQRLPRLIGIGEAKELLYTGDIIDANLAYELGLINKVVTPRSLYTSARELALQITDRSAQAVTMIKKAINKGYNEGIKAGSEYESNAFAECFKTEEHSKRIREIKRIVKEDN